MTQSSLADLGQDREAVLLQALRRGRAAGRHELLAEVALHVTPIIVGALAEVAAELRAIRQEITALRALGDARPAPEPPRRPSPIGADLVAALLAIVAEASGASVEATSAEILARLESAAPEAVRASRLWPTSPRSLSVLLRHLGPELRAAGLEAGQGRGVARRLWCIRRRPAAVDGGVGVAERGAEGAEVGA